MGVILATFADDDTCHAGQTRVDTMRKLLQCVLSGSFAIISGSATADAETASKRAQAGFFDATGKVACAQDLGQPMGTCAARVARVDRSEAAVVVTFPNGFSRTLLFEEGAFVRGNPTMSGVGTDTDWRVYDGTYFVRVDDQRFELPEALVFGE